MLQRCYLTLSQIKETKLIKETQVLVFKHPIKVELLEAKLFIDVLMLLAATGIHENTSEQFEDISKKEDCLVSGPRWKKHSAVLVKLS